MCPSFRATREEEHSTRGRAHLLWEMMQREVIKDGWRDQAVKESLDLCLSCKGCKSDCPVGVDVATYKAEFLSHYYGGRPRPLPAYAFGHIDLWARLASNAPGLVNLMTQLPYLSDIAKVVVGMPLKRKIPAFAPQTFREWFRRRTPVNRDGPPVVLWPDTFNNYFCPDTSKAAVEVLEAGGFRVHLPQEGLCCGRPLYDFGMLERAKRLLLEIMDALSEAIDSGLPVVVLEPSCAAVFRDELTGLFPSDERAHKLSKQIFLFSEFLEKHSHDFHFPHFGGKALFHGHCHHKSMAKMTDEESVLRRLGIDFYSPAPGCCGMAGSFGFERDKYHISLAVGELELLPAVREAEPNALIIADGFSCREQIAQGSNRHALHLAEVIQMTMRGELEGGTAMSAMESRVRVQEREVQRSMKRAGFAVAALGAALGLIWFARKFKS